jgi:hypothetical protein
MNCNQQKLFVKDGLIIKHTDDFDLYKWSASKCDITGFFIGMDRIFRENFRIKLRITSKYILKMQNSDIRFCLLYHFEKSKSQSVVGLYHK